MGRFTATGAANRAAGSNNERSRLDIARRVLIEAGLRAVVKAAVVRASGQTRPGVMAKISHDSGPQHALYGGALLGLLTQQPATTVFHVGDGDDVLHVFETTAGADDVARAADAAGVHAVHAPGEAYVVNPTSDVTPFARAINASSHTAVNGRAVRLGSSAGAGTTAGAADARADYRTAIADAERAAGF